MKNVRFVKITLYALIFLWAFFLLWLIPVFFFHYEGDWTKKVQEKIQLKEM